MVGALSAAIPPAALAETQPRALRADSAVTRYRTARVDGIDIFYREAGAADAPAILLLHGFPTSSHMFRNLIPALAHRYRVIAPDYPGFGHSGTPDRRGFTYSFARFAELMDGLLNQLGVERYALYMQDYGAPVGFRLALRHPERIMTLVVQNGNAYEEGLKQFWNPIKAYWADGSDAHRAALRAGLTLAATKSQYLEGVRDPSRVAPDAWLHDQALLDRPGIDEIMLDLFKDYGSNVARRRACVPARSARRGTAPARHRSLRPGGQGRRHRHAHARFPRSHAAAQVTSWCGMGGSRQRVLGAEPSRTSAFIDIYGRAGRLDLCERIVATLA